MGLNRDQQDRLRHTLECAKAAVERSKEAIAQSKRSIARSDARIGANPMPEKPDQPVLKKSEEE
jgi:hypothetical protein